MNNTIFSIQNDDEFNELALQVFHHQAHQIPIYRDYLHMIGCQPNLIKHYREIPFLPIEFFKSKTIIAADKTAEAIFTSSGTTGAITSQHFVADLAVYENSFRKAFQQFYGDVEQTAILALLPSYSERSGSSLIYMVDDLIKSSNIQESGYFLYNHDELFETLCNLKLKKQKTMLIGVTYALLDFTEHYEMDFPELIVMETGGMKGRRKEMVREELHAQLTKSFAVNTIHSEYGMTELLSQAYSKGLGLFQSPKWLKILLRDTNDPLSLLNEQKNAGAINVIDLANYNSCSFIATQDLGKLYPDGLFEILGRFDHSDVRGCNLLVQ